MPTASVVVVRLPSVTVAPPIGAPPGLAATWPDTVPLPTTLHCGNLNEPIRERASNGMPVMGTCAGMIVMATGVDDGEPLFSLMDVSVRRNAYGRQVDSFEADVNVEGIDDPVRAVFIRAPWVERIGEDVRILAEYGGRPVVMEQANLVAAAFHPELAGESRLHDYFLKKV